MNNLDFVDFFQCDRTACQEKIIEIIQENKDKPIAIAINGKWGVGKTYFWKNTIAPLLADKLKKQTLYTSVFGKNNEQDIIQDLVAQFLKKTNAKLKAIKSISNIVTKAFGVNADIGFIFDLFEEKDLHNTIVCIDDFERLSDKIPLEDILGLICELKENKGCSVIVLYNEDELFKTDESDQEANQDKSEQARNKRVFEKYKEKVFDLQIKFAPPTTEQFSIFAPKDLSTDFDSYKYLPDILNINKLLESHHSTNLRDLSRVNYTYHSLLKHFSLKEHPSEEFKKIYSYLLYPIAYAYQFKLNEEYFQENSARGYTSLFLPHTSMYDNLLKMLLSDFKYGFEFIEKTGFFHIPSLFSWDNELREENYRFFLFFFTKKIIDDTNLHKEYLKEWDKKTTLKEASNNFFLKHKNDIKNIPYMFGYRILSYAFDDEADAFEISERTKSFALDLVMEEHKQEVLDLFDEWCNKAYDVITKDHNRIKDKQEYFWVNSHTFYSPLEYTFNLAKHPIPQNKLVQLLNKH